MVDHIVRQIGTIEGVVGVNLDWPEPEAKGGMSGNRALRGGRFYMKRFDVSSPQYDNNVKNQTISLVSEFRDDKDKTVGRVEVIISFDALLAPVVEEAPWWESYKVFLLDGDNNVLFTTGLELDLEDMFPMRAFGTMSILEMNTLEAIKTSDSGTVFGPGKPPEEISGFYHLNEAPWTMVIIAPGEKVLQPIIRFRLAYIVSFAACILLILLFIRMSMGRVTTGIRSISEAAKDLAAGNFGKPLEVSSRDEVGELTGNFNRMSHQLKQRLELQEAINVAREVQQNLLPRDGFTGGGIEISGVSLYCDETGGDYFDIIRFPEIDGKVGVVVGDVVGHGVGAALLMTTVRALVRSGAIQPGGLAQMMDEVNKLLYQDTVLTGSFVTLIYLEIDNGGQVIRWVRAGHDPAMVIDLQSGEQSELKGEGLALGIDPGWDYTSNEISLNGTSQLILLGSDGVWEVMNRQGEQYGKQRVTESFTRYSHLHPKEVVDGVISDINTFTDGAPPADDITLAVIKVGE